MRFLRVLPAFLLSLSVVACAADDDLSGDESRADLGSCELTAGCGDRDIEVIFTEPFCDECTSDDKKVLLERSQIIKRVVDLIEGAERSIEVAQFTFSRKEIEAALVAAHQRGVDVRIAMDKGQDRDGSLSRRLLEAGIDVRFVAGKELSADRSGLVHTKFMVVDDKTLLTGSNNWSSTGTSINNENTMIIEPKDFGDEIVSGFNCHFDAIWESDLSAVGECNGENVKFTPGTAGMKMIRDSIRASERSIDILMHHFTFADLVKELAKAQERGVQVRLIINEADRHDVDNSNFQRLIAAGGQVHFKKVNEEAFQFMHHKLAIFDGKALINGSGNWSGSAFFNNYENYVRYYEPQVVRQFEDMYERLWDWSLSAEGLDQGMTAAEVNAAESNTYFGNLHAHFHAHDGEHKMDDGKPQQLDAELNEIPFFTGDSTEEGALIAWNYAKEMGGLDFMALSPHVTDDRASDAPDMANMSQEGYESILAAAERINELNEDAFVALPSMEWSTNSSGNHVGIFGTKAIAKVERGEFDKLYDGFLKERYDAGERPLMMMNHPKTFRVNEEFLTGSWDQIFDVNLQEIPNNSQRNKKFNDYGLDDYSPLRELLPSWIDGSAMPDREIVDQTLENVRFASEPYARLMEVTMGRGNEFGEEEARNPSMSEDEEGLITRRVKVHSDFDYYLLKGFKLAPVSNHDNHFANWGTGHTSRTGVVARKLDKKGLLDSLDRRSVFASEDQNLALRFYMNERVTMGSETATTASTVKLDALIEDPDYDGSYTVTLYKGTIGGERVQELQTVTLNADGWLELEAGVEAGETHFFYIEIFEDGADRMAWSAPIWVEAL